MNLKRVISVALAILVVAVNGPHSQGKPAPPKSDLEVSLKVTYNKDTKKFLLYGTVVNLGPDPSKKEGRLVTLSVTEGAVPIPDPACEKCATLYGSSHSGPIKFEPIPALPIIKPPAGSAGKFSSFFDISAEVERKDDDKKTKYVYSFEISLSPSQTDPNPKNDRAEFAGSNIGRGK